MKINFEKYIDGLSGLKGFKAKGRVTDVEGSLIKGYLPGVSVRGVCEIYPSNGEKKLLAEVIGFQGEKILLMPLGEMRGLKWGSRIVFLNQRNTFLAGKEFIGRVIDGMGEPIDGKGEIASHDEMLLYGSKENNPLHRSPVTESLALGIRAVDGLVSIGKGQRMGILSGSGVGKSVLFGMIARNTFADINVIAMIGERGREVRDFIEYRLGEEGLKKSIIVVATSDQSPLLRIRGAFLATALAEYFCKKNKDVLLMMDSITRVAMAQREIGLNLKEAPGLKGYTPSVFSLLPKLAERVGSFENYGSITGLYSVLVEGDDLNDPIGDTVRSILDGHIVLDRKLAQKGHFPAINVLESVSRVMSQIVSEEQKKCALAFRENLAIYSEAEDLIKIGAYKKGSDQKIDKALKLIDQMTFFLKQEESERPSLEESLSQLKKLFCFD